LVWITSPAVLPEDRRRPFSGRRERIGQAGMERDAVAVVAGCGQGGLRVLGRNGADGRARIFACAVDLARQVGLDALSFGGVAEGAL